MIGFQLFIIFAPDQIHLDPFHLFTRDSSFSLATELLICPCGRAYNSDSQMFYNNKRHQWVHPFCVKEGLELETNAVNFIGAHNNRKSKW